ncbi:MAG: transporter [Eggerthellaceae bacterium]
MTKKLNKRASVLIALHILLLFYSLSGIFSKNAAYQPFLSMPFILLYAGMLMVLFVYAIGWQQIIKRLPLTLAFANKAVTVVWGILWGVLIFHEQLNAQMVIGAILVIAGIVLYSFEDGRQAAAEQIAKASQAWVEAANKERE